jgi:ATP-grasp domain
VRLGDRRRVSSLEADFVPRPSIVGALAPADVDLVSTAGAPARSPRGNPAVLFVDGGALAPFVQLAVALRRWGYRTIRVTTAHRSIGSSFTRRFAFDRVLYVNREALAGLDILLADEQLVDVHCTEHLAVMVYRALDSLPGSGRAGWRNRGDLIDKGNVIRLLDAVGIEHPDTLPATGEPDDAVTRLGLPIVAKPRVGANGRGVFVAHTAVELGAHLEEVSLEDTQLEAFISGESLNYCAIVGEGAERDMTYRTLRRGAAAWSPSIEVECYRDDALTEIGRRLAEALPCQGMVNVDAILDANGRYFVHDVNLRVWGALFASWSAGFDLTGAYMRWLADQVRRSVGDAGRPVLVFPDYAGTALLRDWRRVGLRTLARQLGTYRRLLGSRYVLRELARSARSLVFGERTNNDDPVGTSGRSSA